MEKEELELELEFLQKKMQEAIVYQFYFGTKEEDKMERAARNCALLAQSFVEKKLKNILDKE
jgi:hypothetical protein